VTQVPLVTEPLLGWRLWHVRAAADGYRLESWAHAREWPAGRRMEARCRRHESPRADHRCGLYAFRTREAAEALLRRCAPPRLAGCRPVALGSVSLWGRVIPHRDGWRAQFAYPYELFLLGGDRDAAAGLRDRYAVDVSG
jgi:hypothetical protein